MNSIKQTFIFILVLNFLLGMYLYVTGGLDILTAKEPMQGTKGPIDVPPQCPNLLVKKGNVLLMYNTQKSLAEGVNPILFPSLDNYKEYYSKQRANGSQCAMLYVQEEYDTQGNQVYRARGNPFDLGGGLSPFTMLTDDAGRYKLDRGNPLQVQDASRDNPEYNANMYPGYDPTSQYQGRYTTIDQVHDSTQAEPGGSLNPFDPNWAGVVATQEAIQQGRFEENNVYMAAV